MTRGAGVLRSADVARRDRGRTDRTRRPRRTPARTDTWEATNLLTVASALVAAATLRDRDPWLPLARGLPGRRPGVARPSAGRASDRDGDRQRGVGGDVMRPDLAESAASCRALDPAAVQRIVTTALDEDLGGPDGVDVTSVATIPDDQTDVGDLVARADGVVAGLAVARRGVRRRSDPRTHGGVPDQATARG